MFFEQQTQFLALFEDKFFGKIVYPPKSVTYFSAKKLSGKGGGGWYPLTGKIRKVVFDGLP